MNLIVVSSLTCDEGLFFRYITMMGKTEMGYNILVEAKKDQIDKYYNRLKKHGWYDYVDDFVQPEWAEEGVRIDKEPNYPRTIVTKKISCENSLNILGQMKFLKKL